MKINHRKRINILHRVIPPLIVTLFLSPIQAEEKELRLAQIFTNHCVLQRDMPTPIWGHAAPETPVEVKFANQTKTTKSDQQGNWQVRLDPLPTNASPAELTVSSGRKTITLTDILVGEVWLCSGQSNMGLGLSKATGGEEAIANADHPRLRMFRVAQHPNYDPSDERDVTGEWLVCSPDALRNGGSFSEVGKGFSAVGFFFGRQLLETLDCPIGLIGSYVGGSPVEAWMSEEALAAFPAGIAKRSEAFKRLNAFQQARDGMGEAMAEHAPKLTAWEAELAARNENHRKDLAAWQAAARKAREANKPLPERPKPAALSRRPLEPNRYPHHATVLFRGMIEPLIPYAIRGTIWYQGEANCYPRRAEEYATSFPLMIEDWRHRWGQGEFPFLFVQLPNYAKGKVDWMTLRESQRQALGKVPNSGMAITIDVGDPNDLHPADKAPVAHRLALLARNRVYGEDVVSSGPLIESAERMENGEVRLAFRHTGSGLQALDATEPGGFEVAGRDGNFVAARARIDGDAVIVRSEGTTPLHVRYAWSPNPVPAANLYNAEGLPASPFSIAIQHRSETE